MPVFLLPFLSVQPMHGKQEQCRSQSVRKHLSLLRSALHLSELNSLLLLMYPMNRSVPLPQQHNPDLHHSLWYLHHKVHLRDRLLLSQMLNSLPPVPLKKRLLPMRWCKNVLLAHQVPSLPVSDLILEVYIHCYLSKINILSFHHVATEWILEHLAISDYHDKLHHPYHR